MKITIESEALDSLKAMAQRLQTERDELLAICIEVDEDYAQARYAEDLQFKWVDGMQKLIAKCTKEPEVFE